MTTCYMLHFFNLPPSENGGPRRTLVAGSDAPPEGVRTFLHQPRAIGLYDRLPRGGEVWLTKGQVGALETTLFPDSTVITHETACHHMGGANEWAIAQASGLVSMPAPEGLEDYPPPKAAKKKRVGKPVVVERVEVVAQGALF